MHNTTTRPPGVAMNYADALVVLSSTLAAAARGGVDVGDLLSQACTAATMELPPGMALTDERPGSWEASHVDGLTFPDAVADGPRPATLEVDCPRCMAVPGESCYSRTSFEDVPYLHRDRRVHAEQATWVSGLGWMS